MQVKITVAKIMVNAIKQVTVNVRMGIKEQCVKTVKKKYELFKMTGFFSLTIFIYLDSQFKLAVGLGIAIPLLIIFGLAAAAVLFLLYKR